VDCGKGQQAGETRAAVAQADSGQRKKTFFTDIHRYPPLFTDIHRYWLEGFLGQFEVGTASPIRPQTLGGPYHLLPSAIYR